MKDTKEKEVPEKKEANPSVPAILRSEHTPSVCWKLEKYFKNEELPN